MLSSMRSILAQALLLVCIATHVIAQNRTIDRLDGSSISSSDAESIAAAELSADHVTGAQLAILNLGHLVWSYAFGLRDTARQLPMTTDTNLWAASITKGVFATWVMRLVQDHRFNLDRPVARILPLPLNQYPDYHDSASQLVLDPRWQSVTPRMLLAHTSGLRSFGTGTTRVTRAVPSASI